jgi:hypothetical protein
MAPEIASEPRKLECPRQDSNLRPSAPDTMVLADSPLACIRCARAAFFSSSAFGRPMCCPRAGALGVPQRGVPWRRETALDRSSRRLER